MPESLYKLLQDAATKHGGHIALVAGEQSMTYAELLYASDRTAALFARHGARPGRRVAFCFRKSTDAIVALFGLIRTGATYVPLDPAWPVERIRTLCRDAEISLWTGTDPPPAVPGIVASVTSKTKSEGGASLDSAAEIEPDGAPPQRPPDGVTNILYTSGSTGQPKGVEITERSLLHFSQWVVATFGLTMEDRVANHAPYNFDLSTLDIFAAIRAGATMYPVPERIKMFPYQLAEFIAEKKITTWYSVPSALIMLQLRGRLEAHNLSGLRHVIFAGEVMPKSALQELARRLPDTAFTNLYGPTETNACTWHRIEERDLTSDDPIPIGRPIDDTRVWIVGEDGAEVGNGDSGELLVAGPTLTTGYFGDASSTAHRLIPAPDGRGRAYRTGDRVSRRNDGVLMFHGRLDRMIKCRGHRIEPGEIEAVLCRHPNVKEAAVIPIPDPVFGNRIRAYVAAHDDRSIQEPELANLCRNELPSYMLPDEWKLVDRLPRTDRGKIDYSRLAAAETPSSPDGTDRVRVGQSPTEGG